MNLTLWKQMKKTDFAGLDRKILFYQELNTWKKQVPE